MADLGMRIAEFQLSFWFVFYFFNPKSEIRNPKFCLTGRLTRRNRQTTTLGHLA